jgi:hypothetical protein
MISTVASVRKALGVRILTYSSLAITSLALGHSPLAQAERVDGSASDSAPSIVCVLASGNLFPRGTTMVTCIATEVARGR